MDRATVASVVSKKIIIAGGGLVGSLLAIALKKRGHQVLIFEKRPDIRLEKMSAGKSINLIITAKGIKPLVELNLWERVKEITCPVIGRKMHNQAGEQTFQAYGKDDTECNYSVSRSELNKLLLNVAESAGVQIFFERGLSAIDFKKKISTLENGEVITYDLLFGCDGSGSITRQELIRELGELADYKVEPLGTDYKELLMPTNLNGDYPLDPKCLHIWPRGKHMLMALPNLDGSFTMTLYLPQKWFGEFKTKDDLKNYFETNYPDVLALIPDYQNDYFSRPQGFLGIVRMNPWVYGDQVALLGDAAHAIVPFFGQGMNSGFLDVQFLLSQIDQYSDDYQTIFKKYNQQQKLNGDAIADMSLENFVEMCDKVGDEKFLFRKKVEMKIENAFPLKYRSRYGMVTYTLVPYYQVKEAGKIQDEILDRICTKAKTIDEVDLQLAEMLIDEKLVPWFAKQQISVERYLP